MAHPPLPPFQQQRFQPQNDQPGNPFQAGPNMRHPPNNPGGLLPGPTLPMGALAWSARDSQNFRSDGTNQVWTWQSALFDLRPGLSEAYGIIPAAVPINHEAALGQSVQLSVLVGSADGQTPPANIIGMTCLYAELGNNTTADQTWSLTRFTSITDLLQSGGTSLVEPFGASLLSFTPLSSGLRFWQVSVRLTIPGVAVPTQSLLIQAMIH